MMMVRITLYTFSHQSLSLYETVRRPSPFQSWGSNLNPRVPNVATYKVLVYANDFKTNAIDPTDLKQI